MFIAFHSNHSCYFLTWSNTQSQNASRRGKSAGNNSWVVCLLNGCHLRFFLIILCTVLWSICRARPMARVLVCGSFKSAVLTVLTVSSALAGIRCGFLEACKLPCSHNLTYKLRKKPCPGCRLSGKRSAYRTAACR